MRSRRFVYLESSAVNLARIWLLWVSYEFQCLIIFRPQPSIVPAFSARSLDTLHQLSNFSSISAMSHDQAVKEASAKHSTPAELVGKFQYGTAGVR